MAVGVVIDASEASKYNGKITLFVLLSSVFAATGGLLFGYDTGVTGGVTSMAPFLKKFFPDVYAKMQDEADTSNYCKFDSQLLTAFTSSIYISGLVASFFAAPVTRAFGRRVSILFGGIAFLAGSVLGTAAFNIYMLLIGRLLLGVGIGFSNQSIPLYLSEMAPPKYRGSFNMGFQLCVSSGSLIAFIINYGTQKITGGWGWRLSLGLAGIPALFLTLGALFLPETPNSLIQHANEQDRAKILLQKIRGTEDVQVEFNDLLAASHNSKTIKNSFKKILQRKYRPQLVMSVAIPFFQQMTGINVLTFYAPILFRTIGSGEGASLMSSVVLGVIGTVMTALSLFVVDKVGRRVLFLIGGIMMVATQILIGGIMAAKLGDHNVLNQEYNTLVLMWICTYASGFALSWGPLAWLVPSEIFPLEIRSAAQSINVAVGFLTTFVVSQAFLAMLCSFKSGIFFFFGLWVVVMTVFVYFLLPETKNVPLEKMESIWSAHGFWRKFVVKEIEEPLLY